MKKLLPGFLALIMVGCGTERQVSYLRENDSEFTLVAETTPCFGKCPVYELTIKESGLAVYDGRNFPDTKGEVFKNLPYWEIDSIRIVLINNSFFDMDSVYDNKGVTDLPSTTLTLTLGNGYEKKVRGRYESPESFIKIVTFIERLRKRNFYLDK